MRHTTIMLAAATAFVAASPAGAAVVTLDFEGVSAEYPYLIPVAVQDFYNGGTSADGTNGFNYGVSFSANAEAVCLNDISVCSNGSRGDIGDPASQREGVFFNSGDRFVMNVPAGFTTSLSFVYTSIAQFGFINIYDGLNGTGNSISASGRSTFFLGRTSSNCPGYVAPFCPFAPVTLTFDGTARSVTFGGTANQIGFDDISFDLVALPSAGAVPEPATWAMMIAGFGLAGAAIRRRRSQVLVPG
jgi:hypothetical protein